MGSKAGKHGPRSRGVEMWASREAVPSFYYGDSIELWGVGGDGQYDVLARFAPCDWPGPEVKPGECIPVSVTIRGRDD